MIFAALAFGAATLVEINVVKTVVNPAPAGNVLVQVYNVAENDITVRIPDMDLFPEPITRLQDPDGYTTVPLSQDKSTLAFHIESNGVNSTCVEKFNDTTAYSLIVYSTGGKQNCRLVEDHIEKNETGIPLLRFLNTLSENVSLTVDGAYFEMDPGFTMSLNKTVKRNTYSSVPLCRGTSTMCPTVDLGLLDFGAIYTFILTQEGDEVLANRMEDVLANNVHVAYQVPQYTLMTMGEVMFSITGLEFSYSQSPVSMKSVLQAGWLLTVAFGNVIVLIVAEGAGLEQWKEFALFAGLLLGVSIIFSIMASFYTYVDPEELSKVYLEDSKYGSTEEKKRKPSDNLPMKTTDKSTRM